MTQHSGAGERFDLVRSDGVPLGESKLRSEVHRDGDWHRAIHVWIYGVREGSAFLLLQQRAFDKETMPGKLCATVGGHLSAGETIVDAVREVDEEIGVSASFEDLRHCGVRVCANEIESGIRDRELQDVFLWRNDRQLSDYMPDGGEVHSLVEATLGDLMALWRRDVLSIPVVVRRPGTDSLGRDLIGLDDFADVVDQYPYRVAIAVERALTGLDDIAV